MEFDKNLLDEARAAAAAEDAAEGNSEPSATEKTAPAETATPAETDDRNGADGGVTESTGNDGVTTANDGHKVTEPEGRQGEQKANENPEGRRKPLSQLEKAEFKAAKWKRKAKEMQAQRDQAVQEFNKYKDLNPSDFRNEEDRADFLAWRASQRQRINDFDENIESMYAEHDREVYENKIANCYNEEGAQEYAQLDDHYNEAFSAYCGMVDPDNVILDFLKNSEYEPAMRHVIYQNGDLQELLLGREFNNRHIAAAERLSVLKNLENQVRNFFMAPRAAAPQKTPVQVPAPKAQTTTTSNVAQQQAPARPRFTLPPRSAAPATQPRVQQQQQAVPAPAPAQQPPVSRKAPQVTGRLTRGNVGNGSVDPSAAADSLFNRLFLNN